MTDHNIEDAISVMRQDILAAYGSQGLAAIAVVYGEHPEHATKWEQTLAAQITGTPADPFWYRALAQQISDED